MRLRIGFSVGMQNLLIPEDLPPKYYYAIYNIWEEKSCLSIRYMYRASTDRPGKMLCAPHFMQPTLLSHIQESRHTFYVALLILVLHLHGCPHTSTNDIWVTSEWGFYPVWVLLSELSFVMLTRNL